MRAVMRRPGMYPEFLKTGSISSPGGLGTPRGLLSARQIPGGIEDLRSPIAQPRERKKFSLAYRPSGVASMLRKAYERIQTMKKATLHVTILSAGPKREHR